MNSQLASDGRSFNQVHVPLIFDLHFWIEQFQCPIGFMWHGFSAFASKPRFFTFCSGWRVGCCCSGHIGLDPNGGQRRWWNQMDNFETRLIWKRVYNFELHPIVDEFMFWNILDCGTNIMFCTVCNNNVSLELEDKKYQTDGMFHAKDIVLLPFSCRDWNVVLIDQVHLWNVSIPWGFVRNVSQLLVKLVMASQ